MEGGDYANGRWVPGPQLAGDDTAQSDFLAAWGDWKGGGWSGATSGRGNNMMMRDPNIQRVPLYRYR